MNEFSKNLRRLRRAHKLSQAKLAGLVYVSQPFIAELERGAKNPSVEILIKLCAALDCSADFLLGVKAGKDNTFVRQEPVGEGRSMEMLQ